MSISKYSFERAELRVLQSSCNGDNEAFLNLLADIIGCKDEKIASLEDMLTRANVLVIDLEQELM